MGDMRGQNRLPDPGRVEIWCDPESNRSQYRRKNQAFRKMIDPLIWGLARLHSETSTPTQDPPVSLNPAKLRTLQEPLLEFGICCTLDVAKDERGLEVRKGRSTGSLLRPTKAKKTHGWSGTSAPLVLKGTLRSTTIRDGPSTQRSLPHSPSKEKEGNPILNTAKTEERSVCASQAFFLMERSLVVWRQL